MPPATFTPSLNPPAEGVENVDRLPFLRLHGCDEIQGFLFGGPVDAATMDALLLDRGTGCVWTEAANSSVVGQFESGGS